MDYIIKNEILRFSDYFSFQNNKYLKIEDEIGVIAGLSYKIF